MNWHGLAALVKRELRSYFNTPIAYIAVLFLLLAPAVWLFFFHRFLAADTAHLRSYFHAFPPVFILVLPAITMRSWAEERRLGTEELLLSLPVREGGLIVGKYLALLLLLAGMLLLTLPLPLTLLPLGDFETGSIIGQYLGVFLLGGVGAALGLLVSVVSRNQTSAFLLSVVVLVAATLLPEAASAAGLGPDIADTLRSFSLWSRFQGFSKGVVDSRDLIYYLLIIAGALYTGEKALVLRSWR
jgi:ABC-2 type transport system permease protein